LLESIEIRDLKSHADYEICVDLQKQTWGENFTEIVPPTVLMVAQKIGGLAAGAFDSNGEMVGFIFGQAGELNGKSINWSQMLGVRSELRGKGLCLELKMYHRVFCLANNVAAVYWTYDPLVARNAHFNLNKLGAKIDQYVLDFYPENNGSVLHQGMPLDRFVVEWPVKELGEKKQFGSSDSPIVNTSDGKITGTTVDFAWPVECEVRVEIPPDIEKILVEEPALAQQWRLNTRAAFSHYLQKGYRVVGFSCQNDHRFYCLTSPV